MKKNTLHTSFMALCFAFATCSVGAQQAISTEEIESFEIIVFENGSKNGYHRSKYDDKRHILAKKQSLAEDYSDFKKALKNDIG